MRFSHFNLVEWDDGSLSLLTRKEMQEQVPLARADGEKNIAVFFYRFPKGQKIKVGRKMLKLLDVAICPGDEIEEV